MPLQCLSHAWGRSSPQSSWPRLLCSWWSPPQASPGNVQGRRSRMGKSPRAAYGTEA